MDFIVAIFVAIPILLLCLGFGKSVEIATACLFDELLSKVGDAGFRRRVRLAFLHP